MTVSEHLKKVDLPNGETISYRERPGGKKLILLIHGNMTSSKHWDVLMESFSHEYTIIAPDLRGFGQSTYYKRVQHIRDFSNDIKSFVDLLNLEEFSLAGWSTGGAIAMQFCIDHPGYCTKLILLASASTRGYPFYKTDDDGSENLSRRLTTIEEIENDKGKTIPMQALYDTKNREGLRAVWNAAIYTHNQPVAKLYEEYIDDMLTQRNLADIYHVLNTFNISHSDNDAAKGTGEVNKINVPVLILYGERDYVVPVHMTDEIIEDIGDSAIAVQLINCGHSPLIDDLEQLQNKIETFLKEGIENSAITG
ncbi:alpha/beta fold hydrolase [Lysinibacillus sp. SGAir0095]|uniref:intracellular short-chain-length polyhydroxyalkanoate depolymerase n=1 Tax=Lysinibacillus sp. SGAir0095 TaxID=2070463 RepID=UPI0010CCB947|nr:alpha/beta hydrolase [Lysinibacillus sp. SGAir0095]QCR32212.1 alpha/beta hydrolase [Lysinibacillus sp. SGAir0095]